MREEVGSFARAPGRLRPGSRASKQVPREVVGVELTAESRAALPMSVPREDAVFSVARATLLGAALASGDASLFAASANDRLHETYRGAAAPHLAELRADLPAGALGATLSGSGPTVIVWAERDISGELRARYPQHEVTVLRVTPQGASRV